MLNEQLKEVKGYYCNYCNKFYAPEEVKRTYNIEVIGEGVNAKILKYEYAIKCPEGCDGRDEFEEFNPNLWSHLVAYIEAKHSDRLTFKVPIYANDTDTTPIEYKYCTTVEEVEQIAGRLCVEVVKTTLDLFEFLDVEVDFV